MKKQMLHGMLAVMIIFFAMEWSYGQKAAEWVAPASASSLKNPFPGDPSAIAEGKKLFTQMCVVCHGETGKGNGVASVTLTPHPANFLSIQVENESDGAVFWKMTNGNPPMASYKTLLTETQRWQLVNYIRELESKDVKKKK